MKRSKNNFSQKVFLHPKNWWQGVTEAQKPEEPKETVECLIHF